ncbi:zona pellucida-like domain-containing protein 1 [Amia ocellicauda]|uniref:zona pellucida-like domain-containing protein 1 n=1 Tax=Amia ocellicauda TaxID=2972642 RepID=UPI0034647261
MLLAYLSLSTVLLLTRGSTAQLFNCSAEFNRVPDNQDLKVDCGPQVINLEVNLCTAQYAGFDPTGLALNSQHNISQCAGTIDTDVSPPVIRYRLSITQDNVCAQSFQIVNEGAGNGIFSSFSNIQSVLIAGYIDTPKSSQGIISYSTDLYYYFTCRYPLEYFLNNTQIITSSVSLAMSDNNGSFISTLSMKLYNDSSYSSPLTVPDIGIPLQTLIYVEVSANNLTENFNVLLDHCFATPSPFNATGDDEHNFFIGCNKDVRTTIVKNGVGQKSQFFFEAFRFVQHRDKPISTLYLHCITRLCQPQDCQNLLASCSGNRKKRQTRAIGSTTTDSVTVSAGPLYTKDLETIEQPYYLAQESQGTAQGPVLTGLVIGLMLATVGVMLLVLGGWFVLKTHFKKRGLIG